MAKMTDPTTLSRIATLGFQRMDSFRKNRLATMRHYVGRLYGQSKPADGVAFPLNMIYHATSTLVPNLVFSNPKAMVTARMPGGRLYARLLEEAINHAIEEVNLRHTLRMAVTDSIFLAGFVKTGLSVSGQVLVIDDMLHDIGAPFADRVDPDHMVVDPIARVWEEQRIIGNSFRLPKSVLLESGLYDSDAVDALQSSKASVSSKNTASDLTSGPNADEADGLMDMVDLVELYLPHENLVITMPWQDGNEVAPKVLRMVEYQGPERGPYHMLGYSFVGDNIMPVAPAMIWYDLHIMANRIAYKQAQQAERQKSVLAYEATAWQDAQEVADANDGDAVRVDNIEAIREVAYGGATDAGYKYLGWVKNQFSEMAMNIDLLSGAGSSEDTATQAEMVSANTNVRLNDMQDAVYRFAAGIMESFGFFLHTDPLIQLPMSRRISDMPVSYTPEQREGDWMDYNIVVRPNSMARQDSQLKVRRLLEVCGNVIPALANAATMLGPAFNIEAALEIIGHNMQIEELPDIINTQALQQQMMVMQAALNQGLSAGAAPSPTGGVRPQQPNPYGSIRTGITPMVERNMRRQDTAAELQAMP